MKTGDRIRKARQAAGLSQSQLADRITVSAASVSMYESGAREPYGETLVRIANATGFSTDYLLGRIDEAEAPAPAGNPALPPILERMFAQQRLQSTPQIALFTNGALSAEEIERLRRGESPANFEEEKLVRFFRKFNLEAICDYYRAAHVPLPREYQDIESQLRALIDRVYLSTDGSPEALEFVLRVAREEFEKGKGK